MFFFVFFKYIFIKIICYKKYSHKYKNTYIIIRI